MEIRELRPTPSMDFYSVLNPKAGKKKNQKGSKLGEPVPNSGFLELVRGAYVALPHCTASVLSLSPLVGDSMKPKTISSLGVSVSL